MDINKYCNLSNCTTIMELSDDYWTILDTLDWEKIKDFKWFAKLDVKLGKYYAHHTTSRKLGKQRTLRLHRVIMGVDVGEGVDHINGDPLDNRRVNLRIDTERRNSQNYTKPKTNTSGYKGVSWFKKSPGWRVQITIKNKKLYLGKFKDLERAMRLYDIAACYYHKEFANLNCPEKREEYLKIINANHIDSHLKFKTLV